MKEGEALLNAVSARLRTPAVAAAMALGLFAILAMRPAGAGAVTGPHMSPHLTAVQGPEVAAVVDGSVHQTCVFTAAYGFPCYGPYDLGRIYNFPANLDGSGQTIVIVDAYGSPTIATDLAIFDAYFQVPAPPSFTIVNASGTGATGSGSTDGWAVETSLDVEYAHAMAPGANIVLAVAATDSNYDLNAAEAQVFPRYPGAIVSQSFGDWETDPTAGDSFAQEHRIFQMASRLGDTLIASTGDAGATWTQYTGTTSPALASYPASDPLVTSVGGTQGKPYPGGLEVGGAYGGEGTWNEPQFDAATGGGVSILFHAPSYQRGVTGYRSRTIPDVAYNAAIEGGVEVVRTVGTHHFIYLVGGTSCGSPQWAAIFALTNQARAMGHQEGIGTANPALYRLANRQMHSNGDERSESSVVIFHDVTTGNNALDSTVGFAAGPGYDLTTGWGTPNVANLVDALSHERADRTLAGENDGDGSGARPGGGAAGAHGGSMRPAV